MSIKFILFLLIAVVIYSAISWYIGWNLRIVLKQYGLKRGAVLYWLLFSIIAATPFLWRFINSDILKTMSDYWMFFFMYGLLIAVISNLLSLILKRRFTKIIGTVGLLAILVLFAVGQYKAFTPVVQHLTIDRPEVAQEKQLKIVFVADLHLGILSDKDHLKNFVEMSNKEKPDVVILAGDIIDDSTKWFKEQNMQDELKKLKATYGVYGVLGNHEYIGDELKEFDDIMKASQVTMLQDETVDIGNGVMITGRDDATNDKRLTLKELQQQVTDGEPWFVLDHQPPKTLNNPDVSLMMSGHTHNGQIWPGNLLVKNMYSLSYGHEKANDTDYIVTSGFGFWGPPMRVGTDSELWSITMNFK